MSKNKGFTLAEVLITLGIIGIVAAMTIPTILAKYQEKQTVIKTNIFNFIASHS
jgi:prepilin-type cleavage/methylation N-terminal domain protein